jgi:hypothetical protein
VIDTGVPAVPKTSTPGVTVRGLADPNHALRAAVPVLAAPPGTDVASAALLVDRAGRVLRAVPGVTSAADFESDLKRLW